MEWTSDGNNRWAVEVLSGQIMSLYKHQLLEGDSSQQATLVLDNWQMYDLAQSRNHVQPGRPRDQGAE